MLLPCSTVQDTRPRAVNQRLASETECYSYERTTRINLVDTPECFDKDGVYVTKSHRFVSTITSVNILNYEGE